MVVALLALGGSEAGDHGTGGLFRGEGASQLGDAVRLAAGLVMSATTVRRWRQQEDT